MPLLGLKEKLLIQVLSKKYGPGSVFMRLAGKNKTLKNAIHKYYTRPLVATDVVGGKAITSLLNNIKGKGKVARGAKSLSKKFFSNEIPISVAGGKATVIPRVPLLSAPLGHARDIVVPGAALVGGAVMANALSGLGKRKRVVKEQETSLGNKLPISEDTGGFYYG